MIFHRFQEGGGMTHIVWIKRRGDADGAERERMREREVIKGF